MVLCFCIFIVYTFVHLMDIYGFIWVLYGFIFGFGPLGRSGNSYADIPEGVDVLVTHDGPFGIFDMTGASL